MKLKNILLTSVLALATAAPALAQSKTWTADNGNGTFTNPLFYDEFSDELKIDSQTATYVYAGLVTDSGRFRFNSVSGDTMRLAGLLLVGGTNHTLNASIVDGRGFTAVMVSWLGKFNPIYMILTAFLVVFLQRGTSFTGEIYRLDTSMADIFIGAVLLFIIGCEFFINYKIIFRKKEAK